MRRLWTWTLPLVIASTIVWLSFHATLPAGIALPHLLGKLAHGAAFALLALALEFALRATRHDLPMYRRHLWIFLFVAIFGATTEWHHSLVSGRHFALLDWLANLSGGALALLLACLPVLRGRHLGPLNWWKGRRQRTDPSRPLILVADPHWGEDLVGLREATLLHPEADWLFLGDVFDVWVGFPEMQTEAQRSFLWWVRERRAAGRWVGLWMGNRDYFLDGYAKLFDLMGEGSGGALPEEALAFEHGDLINGLDRGYRIWNLLSRSGFTWLLACVLPGRASRKLSERLERSLRTTNAKYRLAFPRDAFCKAAAKHPDATFITGHFHTHEIEGRAVALPWAHDGAFVCWHQGNLEILPPPSTMSPGSRP